MKTLTQLKGTLAETDYRESRGILQAVHNEPVKGFFRKATLGGSGLVLSVAGKPAIAIPLDEIFKLAETHAPELCAPKLIVETKKKDAPPALSPKKPAAASAAKPSGEASVPASQPTK